MQASARVVAFAADALFQRIRIEAQMHGGGHERGMRSGTLPTHQIVGMGEAYRLAKLQMAGENEHVPQAKLTELAYRYLKVHNGLSS